jgi:hypothetical protein
MELQSVLNGIVVALVLLCFGGGNGSDRKGAGKSPGRS